MKKYLFLVTLLALTCSCNVVAKQLSLLGGGKLQTDSIVFEKDQSHATIRLYVDFPTSGNDILVNAIAEYISETLGGTYEGDLKDGKKLVNNYGQKQWESLRAEYVNMTDEMDSEFLSSISFYTTYEIRKIYETDLVVTYASFSDTYLGGAHGMQYSYGVTFRKSDGRRFSYAMMRELGTEGFYTLTKNGLKEYFDEATGSALSDEELKGYLLTEDDVNYLTRPHADPYMVEKGVQFIYQPYEIAPYAAGMPEYTVSYDKILPYLSVSARRMIGK